MSSFDPAARGLVWHTSGRPIGACCALFSARGSRATQAACRRSSWKPMAGAPTFQFFVARSSLPLRARFCPDTHRVESKNSTEG